MLLKIQAHGTSLCTSSELCLVFNGAPSPVALVQIGLLQWLSSARHYLIYLYIIRLFLIYNNYQATIYLSKKFIQCNLNSRYLLRGAPDPGPVKKTCLRLRCRQNAPERSLGNERSLSNEQYNINNILYCCTSLQYSQQLLLTLITEVRVYTCQVYTAVYSLYH